jgi:protein-S-isoprenylcysteine O-methyltransferase Ste14
MPGRKKGQQVRKHRDDLVGEHMKGDAGQLILACLFFVIWIADSFFLNYTTSLNAYVPTAVRIPVGIILLLLSAYLARTGMTIVFGDKRQKSTVIRKNVFGIVRHPIYLSELLLYPGLLMMSISMAAALVWLIAIIFLHYISRYEEKLLLEHFGDEYRQYMSEVPMWIPRLRRK